SLFHCTARHRHTHPFPTRRSSDLTGQGGPYQRRDRQADLGARTKLMKYLGICVAQLARGPIGGKAYRARCVTDAYTGDMADPTLDRKSTRLNSSHVKSSYAVFCLK